MVTIPPSVASPLNKASLAVMLLANVAPPEGVI
jgi:hypothetical protein